MNINKPSSTWCIILLRGNKTILYMFFNYLFVIYCILKPSYNFFVNYSMWRRENSLYLLLLINMLYLATQLYH